MCIHVCIYICIYICGERKIERGGEKVKGRGEVKEIERGRERKRKRKGNK